LKKAPSLRAPTRNLQSQRYRWFEEIPDPSLRTPIRNRDDGMEQRSNIKEQYMTVALLILEKISVIAGSDPQSPVAALSLVRRDPGSSPG
jgi:hypothetical protein